MTRKRYILDSSVWIAIERRDAHVSSLVMPLIDRNMVDLVDVIVAEVLRGVRTLKGYNLLLDHFLSFPILTGSWINTSALAFRLGQGGFNPPLVDIYIAQIARETRRTLLTQDRHFRGISAFEAFSFEIL